MSFGSERWAERLNREVADETNVSSNCRLSLRKEPLGPLTERG
jgi:hypothetical protein